MMRRLLHRSNPWAGAKCGRDNCLSCLNGPDNQDCFAKNILYEIKCLDCSAAGTEVFYTGETSRSNFCRNSEHLIGYKKGIASNPLHKHSVEEHKGSKQVKFQFKVGTPHEDSLGYSTPEHQHKEPPQLGHTQLLVMKPCLVRRPQIPCRVLIVQPTLAPVPPGGPNLCLVQSLSHCI